MGAAAAIAGGTALAGVAGSVISSQAAGKAADTQAQAANNATAASQQQAAQVAQYLYPYRSVGDQGAYGLEAALGLGNSAPNLLQANGINSLTFQPTQAQLESTPGYQFDLNQGLQSVQNANAAQGLGISGAALKGAAQYATGLANNTLTTQQGIFQQNLANVLNPLQNLATLGETAASQTGTQTTSNVQSGNQYAIGGANAQAAGTVGSANAISGGLSSLGGSPLNYLLYNQVLGGGNQNVVDNGNF